jgi:hypothetical protein
MTYNLQLMPYHLLIIANTLLEPEPIIHCHLIPTTWDHPHTRPLSDVQNRSVVLGCMGVRVLGYSV